MRRVLDRLEESGPAPVFWCQDEVTAALVEGLCDIIILVGRPDLVVSLPYTLQPNTPWQTIPPQMFCITDMQGPASQVWKVTLRDLDSCLVNGGPDWQQDIGPAVQRWAPLGLNRFAVWPALSAPQTVMLTGIAAPHFQFVGIGGYGDDFGGGGYGDPVALERVAQTVWPFPAGAQAPIEDEFFQALELYAAHYLRFKEGGNEFSESNKLYQQYLAIAQRLSTLEDRRDPYIFGAATGAQVVSDPNTMR